jgi:hypothetical protein
MQREVTVFSDPSTVLSPLSFKSQRPSLVSKPSRTCDVTDSDHCPHSPSVFSPSIMIPPTLHIRFSTVRDIHNVAHQESQFHADTVLPRNDKKEKYSKNFSFEADSKYRKASSRDYTIHAQSVSFIASHLVSYRLLRLATNRGLFNMTPFLTNTYYAPTQRSCMFLSWCYN